MKAITDTNSRAPDDSDPTLEALVAPAQAGDPAAIEALVTAVRPRVLRWVLVRLGDQDEAEDVTQGVLTRLPADLDKYGGRSRFLTWLYRVTDNRARDRLRSTRTRRRLEARGGLEIVEGEGAETAGGLTGAIPVSDEAPLSRTSTVEDPVGRLVEAQLMDLVRAFFKELPGRQRQVFDLVDLQGWTPAETAEALGLRQVTVRTNLLRARRAIRTRILDARAALVEDYIE